MAENRPREPLAERFWKKVKKEKNPKACWAWLGGKHGDGYGHISPGGKYAANLKAHRVSWEIHFGVIPPGLCVLHRCDNPECVNPLHLFLGTRGENNTDRAKKGRSKRYFGETNSQARLTRATVRKIRKLHATKGIQHRTLGGMFGVAHSTIGRILRREYWGHV